MINNNISGKPISITGFKEYKNIYLIGYFQINV